MLPRDISGIEVWHTTPYVAVAVHKVHKGTVNKYIIQS